MYSPLGSLFIYFLLESRIQVSIKIGHGTDNLRRRGLSSQKISDVCRLCEN